MAGPRGAGCPACGASIPALAAACEACGYTFGSLAEPADPSFDSAGREAVAATATADTVRERPVETGPCASCGGELPVQATYCRHCGEAVREWQVVPVLLMIVGFCLTASIVGAVVGIPMQILALRLFREAREGTVVAG